MDFSFSDEQTMVRDLAREILGGEVDAERVKRAEASPDWFDEALWARLAEANLLGLAVPEEMGGMGFGFCELCILLEELGRCNAPVPGLATLVLGALPVAEFGTPEQRRHWLPRVVAGEALLTAALPDPDAAAPGVRARAAGAGHVLEGSVGPVPFARRAQCILVRAATQTGDAVFLLDPRAEGVELTARVSSTGEPLFELGLSGANVGQDGRLGGPAADGVEIEAWSHLRALVAVAALQVGVSDGALQATANYVREREQFGVPIGSFQAVQHRCADGFIDLEAMRWTMRRAAWRIAAGLPAGREARVAKFWAAEGGSRIANSALHLHAGLGSDVDYPIHRTFLWSKSLELCLGSAATQLVGLGRDMARSGPQEAP